MIPERLAEIEQLATFARNAPTGKRPPYGETEARFHIESARAVLANLEHAAPTQENSDTLFVELRLACDEVEILHRAVATIPELVAEVRQLRHAVTNGQTMPDLQQTRPPATGPRRIGPAQGRTMTKQRANHCNGAYVLHLYCCAPHDIIIGIACNAMGEFVADAYRDALTIAGASGWKVRSSGIAAWCPAHATRSFEDRRADFAERAACTAPGWQE